MAMALVGSVVGASAVLLVQHLQRKQKADVNDRSTTSSAGGGPLAYETKKAVDEYVQFHFGAAGDLLPYKNGPKEALKFTSNLAQLCEKHCDALQDFTGETGDAIALDLGCAVGGAAFELARSFPTVLGIDYSQSFVDAAKVMQERGSWEYDTVIEGDIKQKCVGRVAEDIDRARVRFVQGDACNLPADLPSFDAVLAANLLCRLPEPLRFLQRCKSLVKAGGVLVLVSPYSWLPGWTPKEQWVGGYYKDGQAVRTSAVVAEYLSPDFDLLEEQDLPFLIREHARKFQWGCSHATVWKRKKV